MYLFPYILLHSRLRRDHQVLLMSIILIPQSESAKMLRLVLQHHRATEVAFGTPLPDECCQSPIGLPCWKRRWRI